MRFNLDSIFIADRGLIIMGAIIVFYSILCLIGLTINSFIILLIVFYNSILTIIFLSIFSMGALAMNDNLLDWIDNHWDLIRNSVFSFDMNTFKDHVTTEINSLGIFSLTINATLAICMVCISNLLSFKHILIALSPLTNLITSVLSTGLILIGFYSQQHSYYAVTIPTWSSNLMIVLGVGLLFVGVLGYLSMKRLSRKYLIMHIVSLSVCLVLLLITCVGLFYTARGITDDVNENWEQIHYNLKEEGFVVRKSFIVNQIQINLKFAGFYSILFMLFCTISLATSVHQHYYI